MTTLFCYCLEVQPQTWVTIGTLILAFMSIYQAWRSHRNSKMELRAYLAVEISGVGFDEHQRLVQPAIVIKNNGQTPAYSVIVYLKQNVFPLTHKIFDMEEAEIRKFQTIHKYHGGSTQMLACVDGIEPRVLNNMETTAINSGEMSFFFWGKVVYRDVFYSNIFQHERITNFRFQFVWNNGRFTLPIVCEGGNDAT